MKGEEYRRILQDIWASPEGWTVSQTYYIDESPKVRMVEYHCPLCDALLFSDSSEAEIFLRKEAKV